MIILLPIRFHHPELIHVIRASLDKVNFHDTTLWLRHTQDKVPIVCQRDVAVLEREPLQQVT